MIIVLPLFLNNLSALFYSIYGFGNASLTYVFNWVLEKIAT